MSIYLYYFTSHHPLFTFTILYSKVKTGFHYLQMEQERRDHELALRLATETGSGVEELPVLKRSSLVTAHRY